MNGIATRSVPTGDGAQVLVEQDGRSVAVADVVDDGAVVQLRIRVDSGHHPGQVRRRLLDAVFALPPLRAPVAVQASIPLGDVDLLAGLRTRCTDVDTRAAGATCLVDAVTKGSG